MTRHPAVTDAASASTIASPQAGDAAPPRRPRHRRMLWGGLLLLLFALAAVLDVPLAHLCESSGLARWIDEGALQFILRLPGSFVFALVVAATMLFLHRDTWKAGGTILLSGLPGVLNYVLKWAAGRSRPFKWGQAWEWSFFHKGWDGFINQYNLSFASGDATQAFALATAVTFAVPRLRYIAFGWATLCGLQRIASADHYATDVLAGAVLGVVTVWLLFRILSRLVPPAREGLSAETIAERPNAERPRAELSQMNDIPFLSLVIPCYNEEENVPTLLSRVEASLNTLEKPYEVILIDDGSTDSTPRLLAEARQRLPWLRVLRMAKNSGQSAGFEAGFNAARGQYVATIDADLQNDPEEVPRLVTLLDSRPEYDMVTGWRKDRQDTNFRRWQSRQANKIRNWISQDDINDSASSLKVYRREAIQGLKLFNGAHRFFPTLVKMRGYKVLETPVKHSPRFAGTAKYGFRNRALRAFIDLLGVRWMKMRYLRYQAAEQHTPQVNEPVVVPQADSAIEPAVAATSEKEPA